MKQSKINKERLCFVHNYKHVIDVQEVHYKISSTVVKKVYALGSLFNILDMAYKVKYKKAEKLLV